MLQIKISFYTRLNDEKCSAQIGRFNPTSTGKENIMLTVAKMTFLSVPTQNQTGQKTEKFTNNAEKEQCREY